MSKSIKLKNNTYWDSSAVKDSIRRLTFTISSGSSKTINFTYANFVVLFSSKGTLGGCSELWVICTYGDGTSSRMSIEKIVSGTSGRALTYTIDGRNLIISNSTSATATCSILLLVATGGITIT